MEPDPPAPFDDDEDDDPSDAPTLPGVVIVPEWVLQPDSDEDPVLDDPSSWDEDTKRFRVLS